MDTDDFMRLAYLGILIVAVGSYLLVEMRGRFGQAARSFMAWGLIFIGVMAAYGLWADMRSELNPRQSVSSNGQIVLPRAPDGHYYLTLTISGTPVEFMVDTGATSMILSREAAAQLGLKPDELAYLGSANTANGVVRTARVVLDDVALGPVHDEHFPAFVNDSDMEGSLLGMSYLSQFRIEIDGQEMILKR